MYEQPETVVFNLREALAIINDARGGALEDAPVIAVGLACGFTPLHLSTFLRARVLQRHDGQAVEIVEGTFDDLSGSVRGLAERPISAAVVAIEWSDLDPRLGLRRSGRGPTIDLDAIQVGVAHTLSGLLAAITGLAATVPVVVSPPALPLTPAVVHRAGVIGRVEARLRLEVATFVAALGDVDRVRVIDTPHPVTWDAKSDLRTGFPYPVAHAAELATAWTRALFPRPVLKGLITDLDDTLWRGIVGELGFDGVTWSLDDGSQAHALYQRTLSGLAEQGTLLAACSKNDPDIVAATLARPDLLLAPDRLFPVEASWRDKSAAVADILRVWNLGAADVLFVDDNPRELAEVSAAFPEIHAAQFPTGQPGQILDLLGSINEMFTKDRVGREDSLRADSIRSSARLAELGNNTPEHARESFLKSLDATIHLAVNARPLPARAYELVQKTNQFNLNGRRHDEAQWGRLRNRPEDVCVTVDYEDQYGPLGLIGVLTGRRDADVLHVESWVQSCRAFSRRIEHHVLAALFDELALDAVDLEFEPTERNNYLAEFLDSLAPAGGPGHIVVADLDLGPVHRVTVSPSTVATVTDGR